MKSIIRFCSAYKWMFAALLALMSPLLSVAQPVDPPTDPVPLDTYEWVLLLSAVVYGGWYANKASKGVLVKQFKAMFSKRTKASASTI